MSMRLQLRNLEEIFAGVVLDGDLLTEDEMQNIAKELNLPESVFFFACT